MVEWAIPAGVAVGQGWCRMDRDKLDALIARLASDATRRTAVKGIVGGALASVGALAETVAKKKKRKGKGKSKGKSNAAGKGKARDGDDGAVGTEAKSKTRNAKSKRCKKNGRNCRTRAAGDQQLSAV